MRLGETTWEHQPRGGWEAFQAARIRVGDVMWADSQLHNIVRRVMVTPQTAGDAAPACQLAAATD